MSTKSGDIDKDKSGWVLKHPEHLKKTWQTTGKCNIESATAAIAFPASGGDPEYIKLFKKYFGTFSGKILEIGPGTGFLAKHVLQNNKNIEYTILDIEQNINYVKSKLKEYKNVSYITSKDYKEVFLKEYDLLIETQCLSETPAYYYKDILNNISTQACFVIDESTDPTDPYFNETIASWCSAFKDNSIFRSYNVCGHSHKGTMVYIGKKGETMKLVLPELGQGLQKYNSKDAESIDPTNTLEVFEKEIWIHIKKYFNLDKVLLDVGCGNGRFSSFLSEYVKSVTAIDVFREINEAHQRENITFIKKSLQDLEPEGFDVIFLFGVFYLQENWDTYQAFESLVSKLNEGGVIISIDDRRRDAHHAKSRQLPVGMYNLMELAEEYDVDIIESFIQQNKVHKVTVIKK